MNSLALRFYTVAIALICGGAIAYTINQQQQAATWQTEAASWRQLAAKSVRRDRATGHKMRVLVNRYNQLVVDTRRSQRRLLRSGATSSGTVYRTVSSAAPIPSSSAAPTAVAAPAPVTRTS